MKNLIQYTYKASNLFFEYLQNRLSKEQLIIELYNIEQYHKEQIGGDELDGEDIWFKFSPDDTLATTIANLDMDLEDTSINQKLFKEKIADAISLNGELRIFYS
tara:strand:+ start:199 stop:510 length:312 start_codon:yes stop_codon:yes gene_type:complete